MNGKIASMKATKEVPVLVRNEVQDIGISNVPNIMIFQSLERHIYVTVYDLSEPWGISLSKYTITPKKTTQMFLHSVVLLLDRIYRTDRVFTRKKLQGQW